MGIRHCLQENVESWHSSVTMMKGYLFDQPGGEANEW